MTRMRIIITLWLSWVTNYFAMEVNEKLRHELFGIIALVTIGTKMAWRNYFWYLTMILYNPNINMVRDEILIIRKCLFKCGPNAPWMGLHLHLMPSLPPLPLYIIQSLPNRHKKQGNNEGPLETQRANWIQCKIWKKWR